LDPIDPKTYRKKWTVDSAWMNEVSIWQKRQEEIFAKKKIRCKNVQDEKTGLKKDTYIIWKRKQGEVLLVFPTSQLNTGKHRINVVHSSGA